MATFLILPEWDRSESRNRMGSLGCLGRCRIVSGWISVYPNPIHLSNLFRARHEISVSNISCIWTNCIVPFSVERVGTNIYFLNLLF